MSTWGQNSDAIGVIDEEPVFQSWYQGWASKMGLDPNPDDPRHFYDYRAAFRAGDEPSMTSDGLHWPSTHKTDDHPNLIVGGMNTKTGKPVDLNWDKDSELIKTIDLPRRELTPAETKQNEEYDWAVNAYYKAIKHENQDIFGMIERQFQSADGSIPEATQEPTERQQKYADEIIGAWQNGQGERSGVYQAAKDVPWDQRGEVFRAFQTKLAHDPSYELDKAPEQITQADNELATEIWKASGSRGLMLKAIDKIPAKRRDVVLRALAEQMSQLDEGARHQFMGDLGTELLRGVGRMGSAINEAIDESLHMALGDPRDKTLRARDRFRVQAEEIIHSGTPTSKESDSALYRGAIGGAGIAPDLVAGAMVAKGGAAAGAAIGGPPGAVAGAIISSMAAWYARELPDSIRLAEDAGFDPQESRELGVSIAAAVAAIEILHIDPLHVGGKALQRDFYNKLRNGVLRGLVRNARKAAPRPATKLTGMARTILREAQAASPRLSAGIKPQLKSTGARAAARAAEVGGAVAWESGEEGAQGIVRHVGIAAATYLDKEVEDQDLNKALHKGIMEGVNSIVPLAFTLGAGGAVRQSTDLGHAVLGSQPMIGGNPDSSILRFAPEMYEVGLSGEAPTRKQWSRWGFSKFSTKQGRREWLNNNMPKIMQGAQDPNFRPFHETPPPTDPNAPPTKPVAPPAAPLPEGTPIPEGTKQIEGAPAPIGPPSQPVTELPATGQPVIPIDEGTPAPGTPDPTAPTPTAPGSTALTPVVLIPPPPLLAGPDGEPGEGDVDTTELKKKSVPDLRTESEGLGVSTKVTRATGKKTPVRKRTLRNGKVSVKGGKSIVRTRNKTKKELIADLAEMYQNLRKTAKEFDVSYEDMVEAAAEITAQTNATGEMKNEEIEEAFGYAGLDEKLLHWIEDNGGDPAHGAFTDEEFRGSGLSKAERSKINGALAFFDESARSWYYDVVSPGRDMMDDGADHPPFGEMLWDKMHESWSEPVQADSTDMVESALALIERNKAAAGSPGFGTDADVGPDVENYGIDEDPDFDFDREQPESGKSRGTRKGRKSPRKKKKRTRGTRAERSTDDDVYADLGGEGAPPTGGSAPLTGAMKPAEGADSRDLQRLHPLALVELISLLKALTGKLPFLKALARDLNGSFSSRTGNLELNLNNMKDFKFVARVLAHEMGHMIDWLPQLFIRRANLLGKIASIQSYKDNILGEKPGVPGMLTDADRARFRQEAVDALTAEEGTVPSSDEITAQDILNIWNTVDTSKLKPALLAYIKTLNTAQITAIVKKAMAGLVDDAVKKLSPDPGVGFTDAQIQKRFEELCIDELIKRRVYVLETIEKELKALSKWWKPFDEARDPGFTAYRFSAVELYADALSVLFRSPEDLYKRAPEFYRGFMNWLGNKPDVLASLKYIQDLLNGGPEVLSDFRKKRLLFGFQEGEEARDEATQKRLDARVSGWDRTRRFVSQYLWRAAAPIMQHSWTGADKGRRKPLKKMSEGAKRRAQVAQFTYGAMAYKKNANHLMLTDIGAIATPLFNLGVTENDIGEYLFHYRITGEKRGTEEPPEGEENPPVIMNPQGYDPDESLAELGRFKIRLDSRLGHGTFQSLEDGMRKFHEIIFKVAQRGHDAGLFTDNVFETMEDNKEYYAAWHIVKYINSDFVPASIKQRIGTFEDTANPWQTTLMKMVSINNLIDLTTAKTAVIDGFIARDFPQDFKKHRGAIFKYPPKTQPGRELVYNLEDGVWVAYEVPEEIAAMFQSHDVGGLYAISQFVSSQLYGIFHPLYVTLSTAFHVGNIPRDTFRSWSNLEILGKARAKRKYHEYMQQPGMTSAQAKILAKKELVSLAQVIKELIKGLPEGHKRAMGVDTPLVRQMLESRALGVPFTSLNTSANDKNVLKKLSKAYGLGDRVTDQTIHGIMRRVADQVMEPLFGAGGLGVNEQVFGIGNRAKDAVFSVGEYFGTTAETASKVAGWNLLKSRKYTDAEAAYAVREYVGTPNFEEHGLASPITNSIFMYAKVRWNGLMADMELLRGKSPIEPHTGAGFWFYHLKYTVIPRLITKTAEHGGLGAAIGALLGAFGGDDDDDSWLLGKVKAGEQGVSMAGSWVLDANYALPIGFTDDNQGNTKAIMLTMPMGDTHRFISQVSSAVMDLVLEAAGTKTRLGSKTAAAQKVGSSLWDYFVPSVGPHINVPVTWLKYSAGLNPEDQFYNEPIVPSGAWKAGGWIANRKMIAWSESQLGMFGDVTHLVTGQFLGNAYEDSGNITTFERVAKFPAGWNRFLKVKDTGTREDERAAQEAEESENAQFFKGLPNSTQRVAGQYFSLTRAKPTEISRRLRRRLTANWYGQSYTPMKDIIKAVEKENGEPGSAAMRKVLEQSSDEVELINIKKPLLDKHIRPSIYRLTAPKAVGSPKHNDDALVVNYGRKHTFAELEQLLIDEYSIRSERAGRTPHTDKETSTGLTTPFGKRIKKLKRWHSSQYRPAH